MIQPHNMDHGGSSSVNPINEVAMLIEPQCCNHPNENEYPASTKDKTYISIKFNFPETENYFQKN